MATPVRSEAARLETIAFGSMSRFSFARSALAWRGSPGPGSFRTPWEARAERHVVLDRQGWDEPEVLLHEPASEPVGLHGCLERSSLPSIRIPPPGSGAWYPDRILIRVDFPDPF